MRTINILHKLLLIVFVVSLITSCSNKKQANSVNLNSLYKIEKVKIMDFNNTITMYGYVKPSKKVDIVAYTSGRITRIWKQNGDRIQRGEKIFSIEGYYKIKANEDNGSGQNIAGGIRKIASASGTLYLYKTQVGEAVQSGEIIASIIDDHNLIVEGEVFGDDIEKIEKGNSAIIKKNEIPITGKVIYVAKYPAPQTGGFKVGIKLSQPIKHKIFIKDFVQADIIIKKSISALGVPKSALLETKNKKFVIVKSNKKFIKKEVITGLSNDNYVEIKKGLNKNEPVVTSGAYELFNQDIKEKITIMD